jgi:cell division septation protein DedD/nucleoid DNA-binding protein
MNVSASLLEYLKRNNSAELLGIGTFKVRYTPAAMSPITNTLTPPSRTVYFSKDMDNDLGFAEYMAKNEFITIETAIKWINQYSDSIKEKIKMSKSCKLGDLGTIAKSETGEYLFTTTQGLNLLDSAFAFSPLKSVKTFEQGDFIKPIVTKTPDVELPTPIIEEPIKPVVIPKQDVIIDKIEEIVEEKPLEIEKEEVREVLIEEEEEIKEISKEKEEIKELSGEECVDKSDCSALNYKNSKKFRKKAEQRYKKEKKEKKARRKRNKLIWKILFTIVLLAILLCGFLAFAHYMCWTKDYRELDPITNKLNNFITPKCEKDSQTTIVIPIATPTTEVMEETPTETITEIFTEENLEANKKTTKAPSKPAVQKEEVLKPTGEKDNPPAPTAEIDYSTPILMQPVSRLGFDVVGGSFENRSNAQQAARKARSLGYDSYIINKTRDDKTIYYVSYGSRRTMREANSFMKTISQKHGDTGFIIISR